MADQKWKVEIDIEPYELEDKLNYLRDKGYNVIQINKNRNDTYDVITQEMEKIMVGIPNQAQTLEDGTTYEIRT